MTNKPKSRPVLTLARPPSKPTEKKTAKPAKPLLTPEQFAARIAEERRVASIARATALTLLTVDLMETYPAVFPPPPAAPVPLAIGIHVAIRAAVRGKHSNNIQKVFLSRWTEKPRYLEALAAGEPRRNLDGTLAGELTEGERARAAEALEALKARKQRKGINKSKPDTEKDGRS